MFLHFSVLSKLCEHALFSIFKLWAIILLNFFIMSTVFLFPGQGSQTVGMGSDLFDDFPKEVSLVTDLLGYSLSELCLKGPEEKLGQTQYTQPALYLVSYLHASSLQADLGKPAMSAGHSVGEFAALAHSGSFSFEDGLKMVAKRGEIMSQVSGGGMAAVIGMDGNKIKELLIEQGLEDIDLANFNSPGQIVISGPAQQIESSLQPLKAGGAKLVVPLKVSGAFHSRMMHEPARQFAEFLENFNFLDPQFPVYANVTAQPYANADAIAETLVKQVHSPVRWTETILAMRKAGGVIFEECGPGNVLSKLLRQIK
jgi:malonyl CoA-acyl carrier protein transacylase